MTMLTRRSVGLGLAALLVGCRSSGVGPVAELPHRLTDEEIKELLRQRIDMQRQGIGIVVGLVQPGSERSISHGVLGAGRGTVDGNTVFPIASVTKVFTALLLADAVARGEVALQDSVAKYLPELRFQAPPDRPVTLLDLATHVSGLPTYPDDYPPENQPAARAAYAGKRFYAALAGQRLRTRPGTEWHYSDINLQLVADALVRRTGIELPQLLERRILGPLGMRSTTFAPTAQMSARLTHTHDVGTRAIADAREPAMPASGGLYSSAADLMRLLAVLMGIRRSPLARAVALLPTSRHPAPRLRAEQAIGIQIWRQRGGELRGHTGSKPGAASALLWEGQSQGVAVLSNAAPPVEDLAWHVLDRRALLSVPMKSAEMTAPELQRYVGRYQERSTGVVFAVTLDNGELIFEPVGQAPGIAMSPENDRVFNIPRLRARVEFRSNDLVHVRFGGREYLADRIAE